MLRPLHFVVFLLAISFALSIPTPEEPEPKVLEDTPGDQRPPAAGSPNDDLEPDATYWGYVRPWGYPAWGWGKGWGGWVGPVGPAAPVGYWGKGFVGGWKFWG